VASRESILRLKLNNKPTGTIDVQSIAKKAENYSGADIDAIIDIAIVVKSLANAKQKFVKPLEKLGYIFWPDNPDESEMFFVKGMPPYGERRTHHIRVMEEGKKVQNKRLFRDWLIEHPTDANRYKAIKKDLAIQFRDDREAYTKAKDDFVKEILSKATFQQG
jgi:GrpB-like predicted nucleotidyltransferase (UPF0157 family)